jgi:prolipoprotein diacylglyceryltransferase
MNGRAYKVMLYLGCVAGVYAGDAVAADRGLDPTRFALMTIALLIPAFVGARALFVVRHLDGYRHDARRIAARTEGGAALFGGLFVAIALSVPVLHLAGLPFWTFWDAASITMLVGLVVTRFGCLMNGCCAGRPTDGRLGIRLHNAVGVEARRYPTQLFEAGLGATILVVALAMRSGAPFDGALFLGVVGSYCLARTGLQRLREQSNVREEPVPSPAKSSPWGSSLELSG